MTEQLLKEIVEVNTLLGNIESEIDRANKLLNYDPNPNMNEERLRYIDLLYKAGKYIELIGGDKVGKRT